VVLVGYFLMFLMEGRTMTEAQLPEQPADESEYEDISYEEVDRICASLEELRDTVQSENIKAYLDEAIDSVYYLVYEEADEEDDQILPFSEAA
jgi:hypothetical protein